MIRSLGIVLIAMVIFAFDCTNDNDEMCSEEFSPVEIDSFYYDKVGGGIAYQTCRLRNMDLSKQEVHVIIRSQADLEKFVDCSQLLSIDFNEKTVLAGAFWTTTTNFVRRQKVFKRCDEYVYEVDIQQGAGTAVTQAHYFVVLPRISANASVTFDVSAAF